MSRGRVTHVVVTDAFAGTERYITYVAPALAADGWDVHVIGGAPEWMRRALPGISYRPAANLTAAWAALAHASSDIVHAHLTKAELAAVCSIPMHRGKVISTRHIAAVRGKSAAGRLAAPLIGRALSAQISISQFVADRIGENSVVIPHAVPNAALGDHGDRSVLMIQRLEPEKAAELALQAWATSGLQHRGWNLRLAGDGTLRAQLETLSQRLGILSSVTFLGWTDRAHEELHRCAVLLAPTAVEAFGLSVCEAMAAGTVVVAAAGGAHRELVSGTAAEAYLFPPGNADACAAALTAACALSAAQRRVIGTELQGRQRSRYALTAHIHQLGQLYETVRTG